MEGLFHRERALLGYSSRSSLGNPASLPRSASRTSDVDFSDVFGGPPRRSMADFRRGGLGENSVSSREKEEPIQGTDPWSALRDKPAFGDGKQHRRRHLKEDFFDDIFKVGESLSSTPRQSDREQFASTPASRVHSPLHPSLPRQFSLYAKIANGISSPTLRSRAPVPDSGVSSPVGFPSSPQPSRTGTQMFQSQNNATRESRTSSRFRRLSDLLALDPDEPSEATDPIEEDKGNDGGAKDPSSLEGSTTSNSQFHFSIYKWASKGIPLIVPVKAGQASDPKAEGKGHRTVTISQEPVLYGVDTRLESENSSTTTPSKTQLDDEDNGSSKNLNTDEGTAPLATKLESLFRTNQENSGRETRLSSNDQGNHLFKEENKDTVGNTEVLQWAGMTNGRPANYKAKPEMKDGNVKVKKQVGKKHFSNHTATTKESLEDGSIKSQEKTVGNGAKGKVKEFIKIFSQEASLDTAQVTGREKNNFRKTDTVAGKRDEKISDGKADGTLRDDPVAGNQQWNQSPETTTTDFNCERSINPSFGQIDVHVPVSGTTTESLKDAVGSVVELESEDLQVLDAKIQKWSGGKEGNIRSLLSTLQYVLWPDSGWKPVPLVDIIESACVKRAYQKALLCLHPDKLQQKGAAIDKKYMAEKVFDILQEAWNQFYTLGSL